MIDQIVINDTIDLIKEGKNPNKAFAESLQDQNYYGMSAAKDREDMAKALKAKGVNIDMNQVNALLGYSRANNTSFQNGQMKAQKEISSRMANAKVQNIAIYVVGGVNGENKREEYGGAPQDAIKSWCGTYHKAEARIFSPPGVSGLYSMTVSGGVVKGDGM